MNKVNLITLSLEKNWITVFRNGYSKRYYVNDKRLRLVSKVCVMSDRRISMFERNDVVYFEFEK